MTSDGGFELGLLLAKGVWTGVRLLWLAAAIPLPDPRPVVLAEE